MGLEREKKILKLRLNGLMEKLMNIIANIVLTSNYLIANKELITFVLISIFIIYFIVSLLTSFFKIPFIIIAGCLLGWYLYTVLKKN